jgi:hypothetical protein
MQTLCGKKFVFFYIADMEKFYDYLMPSHFAQLVGVHPSRITRLQKKLKHKIVFGKRMVLICPENLDLFPNRPHVKGLDE